MKRKQLPISGKNTLPTGFSELLGEVKHRIQSAQTRAMTAVNAELVRLYWDIGRLIDQRQKAEGWGASVVPRLSTELRNELPQVKGFSARNMDLMIQFYREYSELTEVSQVPLAKLPNPSISPQSAGKSTSKISQPPVAKLSGASKMQQAPALSPDSVLWTVPWAHHVVLMQKVKDFTTRRWYMEQTLANGWSRNILKLMIDGRAHERTGKAITNFDQLLPSPQSDLAQQALKDPYIFDFLTLTEPFQERELETGLLAHLEKFLIELGQGFAFVGRQYRIEVAGEDYYIDLLFYHLRLRCFVVIDLKKGSFKPEYAGKLNFYCNVVNDQLCHADDQPTIGLILCQSRDDVLAEYALAGIDKPIGVSSYELTRALPKNLQSALPTIEQLEAELRFTDPAKRVKARKASSKQSSKSNSSTPSKKPSPKSANNKKSVKKKSPKKRNDD